jgi:DNA topoisomerase-2
MHLKNIKYVPGFIRIFEEILLNSFDQTVRDIEPICTIIKINVNIKSGEIIIMNNGSGIPVIKHKEYNVWIPSMIFGELLTSSNYSKDEKRITGGKNGYGAKLTNIFSKKFSIETVDSNTKKKFYQLFENNMLIKNEPIIKKSTKEPYVKVSFIPDYSRFNLEGITDDIYKYIEKRTYDISVCSNKNVNIYFNNKKILQYNIKQKHLSILLVKQILM